MNLPKKTLWIGDLSGSEDIDYFKRIFSPIGNIKSFKIFKEVNYSSFYGFLEFETVDQASQIMSLFNGRFDLILTVLCIAKC